jgi:hypothetical protein
VSVLCQGGRRQRHAEKAVTTLASLSTVAGLVEAKDAAVEAATPYVHKARDADGRKEIAEEVKVAATPYVTSGKAKLKQLFSTSRRQTDEGYVELSEDGADARIDGADDAMDECVASWRVSPCTSRVR